MRRYLVSSIVIAVSFGTPEHSAHAQRPPSPAVGVLDVVDFRNVTLSQAMRLFSLQTDMTIVYSARAGNEKVTLFLRNVTPDMVLSALAESNKFAVERDSASDRVRIVLAEEVKKGESAPKVLGTGPAGLPGLPSVLLKGRVLGAGPPRVLLEVDGKLRSIPKNGVFSSGGMLLRLEEATATEVRVLVVETKATMILD
jgi:hypothetical protein